MLVPERRLYSVNQIDVSFSDHAAFFATVAIRDAVDIHR